MTIYILVCLSLLLCGWVLTRRYSPKACYQLAMLHVWMLPLIAVFGWVLLVITDMGNSERSLFIRAGVFSCYAIAPLSLAVPRVLILWNKPMAAARISALFLASMLLATALLLLPH